LNIRSKLYLTLTIKDSQLPNKSLKSRFIDWLTPGLRNINDVEVLLNKAHQDKAIGAETLRMMQGVLELTQQTAGDIMVAAPAMDVVNIEDTIEKILCSVIDIAHSRFPVYEGERENIIGILHTKDLIKLQKAPELNLRTLLRPTVWIPESKGLVDLLRDFRRSRSHMCIVIDEFGRVAGLVTIEDVLEEIVGEIEDEFDTNEDTGEIYALSDGSYRVAGRTDLNDVLKEFNIELTKSEEAEEFNTIGGLIAHEMGYVPRRGEIFNLGSHKFEVMHTKSGAVKWFRVRRQSQAS
jgi:magnesium and cobalt transporter